MKLLLVILDYFTLDYSTLSYYMHFFIFYILFQVISSYYTLS
jgi:hypothetical protein